MPCTAAAPAFGSRPKPSFNNSSPGAIEAPAAMPLANWNISGRSCNAVATARASASADSRWASSRKRSIS